MRSASRSWSRSLRHSIRCVTRRSWREVVMRTLSRDPAARPSVAELFERFDELGADAGVGKVRFR